MGCLSSSRLRTIPFCHSRLPNSNGFILTVSPLFKGSRSTVPLLQYWACRYLRHSSLPRHSSSSVTGCGARKLAVTGRRLLVLLLKRRCAALTWILASRMLQWSSKAKSIQSTRSALSENLLSFLHCSLCFTITLTMIWAAREMFKVPFFREPQEVTWCKLWAVISHRLLRYAVARKMSLYLSDDTLPKEISNGQAQRNHCKNLRSVSTSFLRAQAGRR